MLIKLAAVLTPSRSLNIVDSGPGMLAAEYIYAASRVLGAKPDHKDRHCRSRGSVAVSVEA